ncbi:MAG TPA: hypothetical protein VL944_00700 [Candidatus Acidoferrum sp.]|nr:hypothetical protein [Candidatus Acidoferrum sp.]
MAKKRKADGKRGITTWPLYIVLVAVFILYILFQGRPSLAIIFGVSAFVLIIALIGLEVMNGSRESGKLRNALEIVVAVVAVLIFWFALRALLHTNYPIDAVPSCSMLPVLQRGDLIVLHGANSSRIEAPQVQVTPNQMQSMLNNIGSESLECVAYQVNGRTANISQIMLPGYTLGLFKSEANGGGELVQNSSQDSNLVRYTCGVTDVKYSNGTVEQEAYTKSITIGNTTITGDRNNSIIVYQTIPMDYFYQLGDSYIVHRVYAIINASGTYYYLTKGDNNPGLDMQYNNYPINETYVEGKVIGTIPLLGYLKLILSGTLSQPAGCNSTLQD